MPTASRLPVGTHETRSLALGDVDGDATSTWSSGTPATTSGGRACCTNDGTGKFMDATSSRLPVGRFDSTALALGDVDGDGDLDLILGNRGQPSRLYLNNGTGTFTDATAFRMPTGSMAPARWRWAMSTVTATSTCSSGTPTRTGRRASRI